jgi:hypothetical protein
MNIPVIGDMMLRRLVYMYHHFGGAWVLQITYILINQIASVFGEVTGKQ